MAGNREVREPAFEEQLVLFRYFLNELGIEDFSSLGEQLNNTEYEGLTLNGNTKYYEYFAYLCGRDQTRVSLDKLRVYDDNICRHTRQLEKKRGEVHWKYYQYLSLLFTEMYLDRYFSDIIVFCRDLNAFLDDVEMKSLYSISFSRYEPEKMNKLAFMCATGSGKTLIMHVNIMQYLYYFRRAQRANSRLSINKVIVLAPNETMSLQHLEELRRSSVPAELFQKDLFGSRGEGVVVIDMNKLKEEGKVKTVSVASFEQNNLVLVDEGHRGLSGNIWYDYRTRLSADGFAFEYSATFKQALRANAKKPEERELMEEYGKSIIMDYSYKYFYRDGYGKDYRIYNLREGIDREQKDLYLTGCILTYYQQLKLYTEKTEELRAFFIEKPLLVFVGNRVTAKKSKDELTDIEEVLGFIDRFVRNRKRSEEWIHAILTDNTGLIDAGSRDLFSMDFLALNGFFGPDGNASNIFSDVLRLVFHATPNADEPRLHMDSLRRVPGEIGLKIGEYGDFFGVISVGDAAGLMKNCEGKEIVVSTEEFVSESLFRQINEKNSQINMLVGSRKFAEGWNSWRVSAMGLINFARGEGAQAIQLFGRGVRLKGYERLLKRSNCLGDLVRAPQYVHLLETLTVFGIKAEYMEEFKQYLELEDVPSNDRVLEFSLHVVNRYRQLKEKKLFTIKVKDGISFKKQASRLVLDVPDESFQNYLIKNVIRLDCRSRIQTIDSTFSGVMKLDALSDMDTLPEEILPYLDYFYIYEELQSYKTEKAYYNLSVDREKLQSILAVKGWYSLLIPRRNLEIDSFEKLTMASEYAVMALKSYMDKFYRFEKARWEASFLEYSELSADDANFISEYKFTFSPLHEEDRSAEVLKSFLEKTEDVLKTEHRLQNCEKLFGGRISVYDAPCHLYAPLVSLRNSNLNLQVNPVGLNEGEKRFVDLLNGYMEAHREEMRDKPVFLLRNRSKEGLGFFEAGNFYPDFILWIDTEDVQYLSFIDPKGLMQIGLSDPKIVFYKTIKEIQKRLNPISGDKRVILNSFIMSVTSEQQLLQHWRNEETKPDRAYREARNIYTLDDSQCVEKMFRKILKQGQEQSEKH